MKKTDERHDTRIHLTAPYEDEDIIVHFIGDHAFDRYKELTWHTNPGYEICLVLYGKGVFRINEVSYHVTKNQLFITKEPQRHTGWPAKENPFRLLYICFKIKSSPKDESFFELDKKLGDISNPVSSDRYQMADVHHMLIKEVLDNRYRSYDIIRSLIRQFMILTIRNYTEPEGSGKFRDDPEKKADAKNMMINRIMYFIEDNLDKKPDIETMSATWHYSVSYISRLFKKHTGFSIMEYYNYARLEQAKQMLLLADEQISSIAKKLGYCSIHHFSSSFRSFYGMSPRQYRDMQNMC